MTVLNNRKTFKVSLRLDTGDMYEGQFTTKRLSIKDRGAIGVKKSQLSGGLYCVRDENGNPTGQGLDEDTDYLNAMIAHLEVSLIQIPTGWDLNEISDLELIHKVYKEVMDFEMSFFRKGNSADNEKSGSVGEGNGGMESPGTGSGNGPTKVVDKEVQASLDA